MNDAEMPRAPRWRKIAIVVAGVALAAVVVRSGLGHGLSQSAPLIAARIDGGNGMALGSASDRLLKTAQDDAAIAAVRDMSRRALRASPMEAAALRNIGFLAAISEGEDKADVQLTLAGQLSKRDYFTHAWLLDRRFRQNRVADAVVGADIVLRQRESAWPVIIPELVKISGDPRILKPMTAALVRQPAWRSSYLIALGQKGPDLDAVYAQMRLLHSSAAPPAVDELRTYFARYHATQDGDRVWKDWLALTPDANPSTALREGDFETLRFPPPFAWTLFPSDGVYAEQSPSPSGPGKALYLSFEGNRSVAFAQQSLKLAPGRYQLTLRSFGEEPVKPDQIAIFIGCGSYAGAAKVAQAFLTPEPGRWTSFTLPFSVDARCRLQQLRIIGELGDFRTRAALWIDDVAITRTAARSANGQTRTSASSGRRSPNSSAP